MKPRPPTQEDLDYWNNNEEGIEYKIGPMRGDHVGAANIEGVLLGFAEGGRLALIKVPWALDERDDYLSDMSPRDTVWTTFWGHMPPCDVVIL